jgi:hypothetical protein
MWVSQNWGKSADLDTADVLGRIYPCDCPTPGVGGVCFSDADGKVLEYATEELEVGELDGVDADIVAELNDDVVHLIV